MDKDDFAVAGSALTPLSGVAEAFEKLSMVTKDKGFDFDLKLKTFCDAWALVSALFACLGRAFKFAELEFCSKVSALAKASESYGTLNNVLDFDVQNNTAKTPGSLSRCLRRVRQGLDLIRALFQNFFVTRGVFIDPHFPCLKEVASTAYAETRTPYDTWALRTAVSAGMYTLPTREQLLLRLNETEESAEREVRYIKASLPTIEYIDRLYATTNICLDW